MHARINIRNAVFVPLGISICAAAVVIAARALLRERARPAVLLDCERKAYEILEMLTRATIKTDGHDSKQTECKDDASIAIFLNCNGVESIHVRTLVFNHNIMQLPSVFAVHCGLMKNSHPDHLLVCDIWNCLMALMNCSIRDILLDDGVALCILDDVKAEEVLALCMLLRGKYSIARYPPAAQADVVVQEFPEELYLGLITAYNRKRSLQSGITSFWKLMCSSCSIPQLVTLAATVLFSPEVILKCILGMHAFVHWRPIYAAEIGKSLNGDVSPKLSPFRFIIKQLMGLPATFVSMAVASTFAFESLYCIRGFVIQSILSDIITSIHIDAYLALATADYDPSDDWLLSRCVSQALWQASGSVMDELQSRVPALLEVMHGCRVVFSFPVVSLVMWLGTQWSNFLYFLNESLYMESQFTKSQLASVTNIATSTYAGNGEENQVSPTCSFPVQNSLTSSPLTLLQKQKDDGIKCMLSSTDNKMLFQQTFSHPSRHDKSSVQYGLVLFSMVFVESGRPLGYMWDLLTQHVIWPLVPSVFSGCVVDALKRKLQAGGHTCAVSVRRLGWIKDVIQNSPRPATASPSTCVWQCRQDYLQGFAALRLSGWELMAATAAAAFATASERNDRYEQCGRDVLHGLFQMADTLPLLLVSAVALRFSPNFFTQSVLDQTEIVNQLRSIQHWCPLYHAFLGSFYDECGMSEAQVDEAHLRRHLAFSGSSLGCYQVLEGLQSVQRKIDRPVRGIVPPSLDGPWSVEFREVSFRYSDRHPYVLRRVSFVVNKGEFLGIAGYSGSGKTTLLRLLNRTYAPTEGDIFVNGVHISQYPARMLRRRIANVWQEENNLRFIEDLSIGGNIALGNLWDCSDENICAALSASRALSFVQKRSSGIHAPLNVREFSGGEVERLCIARAFVKAGSAVGLCIFDEPTSAIDTITEGEIFDTLRLREGNNLLRDSTIIIVAHRLATLKHADKIVVLNEGMVAEVGSWETLSRTGPHSCFSRMRQSQQLPHFVK
ncbi:ABC transporter, putative [Trypanosoma brucei brucei TREU927]|uniref:ABC transporter, putative n=1 Tax=Trypanosoma brucei brucei (strain 927/4 GUTat10.1) TaxID=185431 RepID=Q586N6_TRYB2|nr:ABC transporter, putative [Trypanosoma brucei brucei TREU927]AAQ16070.1 ABC transporter, putative [Trypanosoma brucei brucei TREU927]AAX80325.1 ABC transporter, putative [Trypanosoma brucei]